MAINSSWDRVSVDNSEMRVFVASPAGDGPFPGVVLNQGLGGVEGTIQALSKRLAGSGYVVIAPEYYHRQSDDVLQQVAHLQPGSFERVQMLLSKVDRLRDDEVLSDGRAAVTYLRSRSNVSPNWLGVIGFCLGGRIAYLQATAIEDFRAVVPFYPAGLWTAWGDGPTAIARSSGIRASVLGIFGGEDSNPSTEQVQELDRELSRLAKPHEFRTFPGAGHDFQNLRSDNYNEEASRESWQVMLRFLRRQLG